MSSKIDKLRREVDKHLPDLPDITKKVLIIDDNFRSLRTFKSQFRKRATVFTALDLEEALFYMRSENIDIVFCDYIMPVIDGAGVLEVISKEFPEVKRVVLTALNTKEIKGKFEKSNTTNFIFKPYSEKEVFNTIYSY